MFAKISINHNTNVIQGGTNEPLSITLDTPAPAGGLVVKYATTGSTTTATDYSLTAGNNITAVTADTFTIAAGATTANLNVVSAKDIISTPPYKTFTINLPEVVYFNSSSYSAGIQPGSIAAGDFNGDGISDLVTANFNNGDPIGNVSVLLRGGAPNTTNFDVGSRGPSFVTVADFNGDGKSDLVTANFFSNDVSVLLGNGKGSFGTPIKSIVGPSPSSIAVADFNDDGKSDLAVIHAGKQVSIVLGNGDGSFDTPTNFELGVGVLNAESVIVGDFNGDGKFDLATANLAANNISVLLAAKDGGFETSNFTYFKVGTLPSSIAVGDLNGDGKSDLVTANLDSTVSVLLGDGNGSFGSATNIGVGGLEAKAMKIGDFDGDGKADLATANFSSNNISILPGNGDGSFGAPKIVAVVSSPTSLAVGDFNGDGKVDLATASSNGGVAVLYHSLPPSISPLKIVPDGYDLGVNELVTQLESTTDGKVLVVGSESYSSSLTVITRYNADGSLDPSFGIAGKLNTRLQNTAPILVSTDGKITVAGTGPNNQSYVIRFLANGQQPDASFGNNGLYSTGNTNPITGITFRTNLIDKSNEIIINQSGERELYYAKTYTLLDANGKIKPFPIGDTTTAIPLSLNENVLNGILSGTTIDRTNTEVTKILNILGEPLINELRSKFSTLGSIGISSESDGSILMGFNGTSSSGYVSGAAHFSSDGKFDPSFGKNGLNIFPFPSNYQGIGDQKLDKNGRAYLSIYDSSTKDISVYRYTQEFQLDATFGNNGKVTLPQTIDVSSKDDLSIALSIDSKNNALVSTKKRNDNLINLSRINSNGTIDTTFGTGGTLQLQSEAEKYFYPPTVLLIADNQLFFGGFRQIISKYDVGGFYKTTLPTRNDFNGDKKADILWRNDYDSVSLWQMDGATVTSSSLTSIPTLDNSWKVAGMGDFNGDGKSDILWRNDYDSVSLWQMNGSTVTSSILTSIPILDNSWKINGTGDFNGDGKSDILWRNNNGSVVVWAMDGSTVTSSSLTSTPSLDNSWKINGTGDFDGDGKSDILWRNDDGSVALWQMNGSNITASTLVSKLSSDWKINGTGDFNGDGKSDILWRNDNGSVALWQMNGSNIVSSSLTSTPSLDDSWKVAAIDDYNGDGKADILWRNDSGSLATWQMDGSNIISSSLTSIQPDSSSWKIAAPIL
jgi:uncharacterized delta-60 repeat protein